MFFQVGASLSTPCLRQSPSGMKFYHKILEALSCHMVKTRSLSHVASNQYRDVTSRETDGQTELL